MPKRIQRSRAKGAKLPANTVCVTRGTKWGNPYKVSKTDPLECSTVEEAIRNFRSYAEAMIANDPNWLEPLRGKNVACWCPVDGSPCHGDVILELLGRTT